MSAGRSRCKGAATEDTSNIGGELRGVYRGHLAKIRREFELSGDGLRTASARAEVVDEIIDRLWASEAAMDPRLVEGVAIVAIGGYGRGLLFPYSDVDLLFCVEKSQAGLAKQPIRRLSQQLWDCGLQVSINTRTPSECERFEATNPEFGLSLLDLRYVGGSREVFAKLQMKSVARMRSKDAKSLCTELARITRERHSKYGYTLFHLEPNIKDCPGGLRDANVCEWLRSLRQARDEGTEDIRESIAFLASVRCFLHYRHERDDNVLDWLAQDAAAESRVGLPALPVSSGPDAATWMRAYFRHARRVERHLFSAMEPLGIKIDGGLSIKKLKLSADVGFKMENQRIVLSHLLPSGVDPAQDPEAVLAGFAAVSATGARFDLESEARISASIPFLSANLEEGPGLWQRLSRILTGDYAATALRTMHALGVLELIVPEFHGIDALVIRDAYHRYTVDEHTFVLIETLHGLAAPPVASTPVWKAKLGAMLLELQNPALLYLAALLHDTGKGRAGSHHAVESAALARSLLLRLELDSYESMLVLRLIENHLEMSAALRRDIFDQVTVRAFATKVQSHEALRMLTLFTYADIAAVHPDALTPWKAENLWRLSMAAINYLDRNVDEERVQTLSVTDRNAENPTGISSASVREKVDRVLALTRGRETELEAFLNGFPDRYLSTRAPESIARHFEMTQDFVNEPFQLDFRPGMVNEITLITQDRPRLFAGMSSALAAWGMNVVTADAFANAAGVVVDTFRFTDTFRTLELNDSERERFVTSIRSLVAGDVSVEKLLSGRRKMRQRSPRVVVDTRIEFDSTASSQSTLVQVIAQDTPGLLRAIGLTLSNLGHNLEVALIDTEGESAIDVFYIRKLGAKLTPAEQEILREALTQAIDENARIR